MLNSKHTSPVTRSSLAGMASFNLSPAAAKPFYSTVSMLRPTQLSLLSKPSTSLRRAFPGTNRRAFFRIYSYSSNDIKVGSNIEVDGAPFRVLEFLHVKPGKGAAFVRTKLKNYLTGSTVDKTFRAGITVGEADISKETKQYTYKDGSQYVFMDLSTYEEFRLNATDVGDQTKFLKEGMDCILLFWNGKVIGFELPITVQLTVVDVDPGVRGNTVQGGSKPATVDTGAVVSVPLFVNIGDSIMVDTRTGQYMSRA